MVQEISQTEGLAFMRTLTVLLTLLDARACVAVQSVPSQRGLREAVHCPTSLHALVSALSPVEPPLTTYQPAALPTVAPHLNANLHPPSPPQHPDTRPSLQMQ